MTTHTTPTAAAARPQNQPPNTPLNVDAMRLAAVGVLASDLLAWDGKLERWHLLLRIRSQLASLIPAVEDAALLRPVESPLRDDALAEVETTRQLTAHTPDASLRAKVRHVKQLARKLQDLCDYYDLLTGAPLLGTGPLPTREAA